VSGSHIAIFMEFYFPFSKEECHLNITSTIHPANLQSNQSVGQFPLPSMLLPVLCQEACRPSNELLLRHFLFPYLGRSSAMRSVFYSPLTSRG
jgi:hypothetical protein